jgi:hypothetical protein
MLLLTGCSGKKGPSRYLDPEEIFPEDPRDTTTYRYPKSGTGATKGTQPAKTILGKAIRESEYDMFYTLEQKARAVNSATEARLQYLEQGVALSNQVCDRWFDELEYAQANVEFWKNNVAISGGLATTVMAALRSATREIAVISALFSSVAAGFDNFSGSFLFSPDIEKIRKKIGDARLEKADSMKEFVNVGLSYESIKDDLQLYHELCSGSEIRRLLNESLDLTRFTFSKDALKSTLRNADFEFSLKQVNKLVFGSNDLSPENRIPIRYLAISLNDDELTELGINDELTSLDKNWTDGIKSFFGDAAQVADKKRIVLLSLEQMAEIKGYGKLISVAKREKQKLNDLAELRDAVPAGAEQADQKSKLIEEIARTRQNFLNKIQGISDYSKAAEKLSKPTAVIDTSKQ